MNNVKIGLNVLPFLISKTGELFNYEVNVIMFLTPPEIRMPVIIVEKDGCYQDFYYNEGWKMLTEEGYNIMSWEEEIDKTTPSCIKYSLSNKIAYDIEKAYFNAMN